MVSYSDDTNVLIRRNSIEETEDCAVLLNNNEIMDNEKTTTMLFRTTQSKLKINDAVKLDENLFSYVDNTKILGLMVNGSLN